MRRRQRHPTPVVGWKIPWTEEPGGLQSMGSLSRIRLSNFTFTFHFHALEKEMATHSSVVAWRIPGTCEPGGLPSMGSHRVGHYWSDLAAAQTWCLPLQNLFSSFCFQYLTRLKQRCQGQAKCLIEKRQQGCKAKLFHPLLLSYFPQCL